MSERKFISVKEAIQQLDFSDRTLRRWIEKGYIKAYRAGENGHIRFDRDELIRALDRSDEIPFQPPHDPSHS